MIERAHPAQPEDLDALEHLVAEADAARREQRGGELWALTTPLPDALRSCLADALQSEGCRIVIGSIDDVPVGFAMARHVPLADGRHIAAVEGLFVTPGAREVGVGEAMMDDLMAWSEQTGCAGIDGIALPGDRANKNFFERFGLTARAILVHRDLQPRPPA